MLSSNGGLPTVDFAVEGRNPQNLVGCPLPLDFDRFMPTGADPHFAARDAIVTLNHPRWGELKMQNSFPKMLGTPESIRSIAPQIVGEHHREVRRARSVSGLPCRAEGGGRDLMTASNHAGVFDRRLPFGERPALIVIDVVMAYLTPGSPLYDSAFEPALAVNERLVAVTRAAFVSARATRSSTAS